MIRDIILWIAAAGMIAWLVSAAWASEPGPGRHQAGTDLPRPAPSRPELAGTARPGQSIWAPPPNVPRPDSSDGRIVTAPDLATMPGVPWPGHSGEIIRTAQVQGVFLPLTEPAEPPQEFLSPPRSGPWVPARPGVRVPVADTALDVFTGEQARWLGELLRDGLGGYGSVGEYMAAAQAGAR